VDARSSPSFFTARRAHGWFATTSWDGSTGGAAVIYVRPRGTPGQRFLHVWPKSPTSSFLQSCFAARSPLEFESLLPPTLCGGTTNRRRNLFWKHLRGCPFACVLRVGALRVNSLTLGSRYLKQSLPRTDVLILMPGSSECAYRRPA